MLRRFKSLSGLGGLDKLDWLGKDFSTHSLVYGWNGTGKTTLSNILYCLENKEICIDDFDTVQFKLDTQSAGTVTHKDISSNTLKLRVFNEQFINANVHFDGTGSNPIVMIGDSNIKLLEEIESDTKKLESDKGVLLELQEERKKAVDTEEILSNAARKWRQIATDLSATGDKYFGSSFKITQVKNLLSDCKVTHENVNELTIDAQAEVDAKKSIGSVWQKIEFEATEDIDLTRIFDRANKLLGGHVSVKKLADVENLEKPVKEWVEQGVAYHKETDICAFCSNHISTTRLEDLAAQFTDLLADAHSQIDELIQEINSLSFDPLDVDSSKIMPAEQKIFSECKQSMDDSSKRLSSELIKLKGLLVEKKSYITDQTKTYEPVEYPIKDLKAYNTAVSELSASIERNNTLVDNIEEENQANLSILMLNCISKELVTEKYFDNVELNLELDEKISALKEAVEVDAIALEKKKETINDQKKAVEKINGLLSNFFDNKRIQFKPVEVEGITTYQIIRNQKVAKNLSEGEKSVLALAYFLVSLSSSSSNELQNTTVIIDDPVDSQDSNFLFRTYGVIKRCTKDAKQLVIMTHNYEFFNLVRDWFSNTTAIDKSLLLIERNMGQSGEEVKISNLPTLLADYKTEYHYLFSKLYGFAYKNEALDSPMVANIARKTLEYFSSFKWCCKDSVDFGNRIQSKFLKDDATPDERAVGDAIYKFVNEYSHALDPFRPVNITDSEARDTATNALKFIQKSDPEHYKVLKKQCDKHYEMSRS